MKLRHTLISIPADGIWLDGKLSHAPDVRGLVLIVQPGASAAVHAREERIAAGLQHGGLATLTLDLITRHEEQRDPDARFNVSRLGERVLAAADWIEHQPPLTALPLVIVGSGTASAAAIRAAVKAPTRFQALACLAGRPDLAGAGPLRSLRTPTLFVVGRDDPATALLRQAFDMIPGDHDWRAAPGPEPEHMPPLQQDASATILAEWMARHLPALPAPPPEPLPPQPESLPDMVDRPATDSI